MAKKDVIVKVTVNNSGLDFGDDVNFVFLTVSAEETICQVRDLIGKVNIELKEENENGECSYDLYGWNVTTLMDEVCDKANAGWSWRFLSPEIGIKI